LRSSLLWLRGGEILFTTRTGSSFWTVFLAFAFEATFTFALVLSIFLAFALPRFDALDFASVFFVLVFFTGMDYPTSFNFNLRHFISNVLLEAIPYTFKWNSLEDRVEESFHNDLLCFRLWDAA